jgi:transcription elongation factor SPT5
MVCLQEVIEFQDSDLMKHFDLGDQVKVISGCHEGNTGLVIRVDTQRVIVISDMSFTEMELRPRDLSIATTKSSGVDSVGHFQFGDLVNIRYNK